jgi:hypothetical protein
MRGQIFLFIDGTMKTLECRHTVAQTKLVSVLSPPGQSTRNSLALLDKYISLSYDSLTMSTTTDVKYLVGVYYIPVQMKNAFITISIDKERNETMSCYDKLTKQITRDPKCRCLL